MTTTNLHSAYQFCNQLAASHYENFPVASAVLPKKIRHHISAIYAFARTADDIADEGNKPAEQRLLLLQQWHQAIDAIARNDTFSAFNQAPEQFIFTALAGSINSHKLPTPLFHDLLRAFEQDVQQSCYTTASQLLAYCRLSANPVGRLILHLHQQDSDAQLRWSDNICTALQLINFLQDLQQDMREMGRLYIPHEDIKHAGLSPDQVMENIQHGHRLNAKELKLYHLQLERAANLLAAGYPLINSLRGRLKLEISFIYHAAREILNALAGRTSYAERPRLQFSHKWRMLTRGIAELLPVKSVSHCNHTPPAP